LQSKPDGQAQFWLVPRASGSYAGQEPRIIAAPAGFVFHHLNAYEEGDELVLESIHYADFPSIGPDVDFRAVDFEQLPVGQLKSSRINLRTNTAETALLSERCCEFAMVNPSKQGLKARFGWMAVAERPEGNDPLQALKKLDLQSGEEKIWSAAPHGFVSEPVFVPRPGASAEDDGWLLCLVWNGSRGSSDLVILNGHDLSEQAVLELPLAIPHGLHGSWVAASAQ
jgi:all-trans-8'-apo-beta-carotenal 15,15'-oxygenase